MEKHWKQKKVSAKWRALIEKDVCIPAVISLCVCIYYSVIHICIQHSAFSVNAGQDRTCTLARDDLNTHNTHVLNRSDSTY